MHCKPAWGRFRPLLALLSALVSLVPGAWDCRGEARSADIERIAILACHRQNEPAPAIAACVETDPDLVLWIGDNVYADTKDSPQFIRDCYATLAGKPGFQELRQRAPWLVTWDDHDFGLNDAGGEYPLKGESREIFRDFWQLSDEIPAERDGVYYAKRFQTHGKTLQVILLDPRFNREPPGPKADTLGDRQWAWLAERLAEPADLRLVVSGYQILLDADTGSETWAEFPRARQRLFDSIRQQRAEHVVFLTGDQHYGEVCRLRGALGYDAVELQFAGLNQIEGPEFNSTRVTPVSTSKHSYALLDIRWMQTATEVPHLLFRVFDAETGAADLVYRVNFSELTAAGQAEPTKSADAAVPPPASVKSLPAAHAHNDYRHERPLADALAWGFCNVEADVFPVDGHLRVGHDRHELRPERTLRRLYLEPLRARLAAEGTVQPGSERFLLLVDIKSDAEEAYRLLAHEIEPLRPFLVATAGRPAPLEVVVSGSRPIDLIASDPERLVGVDGRLEDLTRDDRPAALMPLVSDQWSKKFSWFGGNEMPAEQRKELRHLVERAHARGQRIRFWATPEDPACWRELAAAGVDLIATDNLPALAAFLTTQAERSGGDDSQATPSDTSVVGRRPDGTQMTPVNQLVDPAGKQIELPGLRPQVVAISPDGRLIATSGKTNEVVILKAAESEIIARVRPPAEQLTTPPTEPSYRNLEPDTAAIESYTGLIFSPDGRWLAMSNVHGSIKLFAVDGESVTASHTLPLPPANAPERAAEIPAGLAFSPGGTRLYVCGNLSNRLLELDAATGKVLRTFEVGVAPFDVVLAGGRAFVSNLGGRRPGPEDLTGAAGKGTRVRVDPIRHTSAEGSVSVIDLATGAVQERLVGRHASALARSPDGRHVVCANSGDDSLTVFAAATGEISETVSTKRTPAELYSAMPNGLAFDPSGERLYVTNGAQNAVAVLDWDPDDRGETRVTGLIPVGWFPGAVAFDAARDRLIVANIKGLPDRPRPQGDSVGFNTHQYHGSLSLVPLPDAARLEEFSANVDRGMRAEGVAASALPPRPGRFLSGSVSRA